MGRWIMLSLALSGPGCIAAFLACKHAKIVMCIRINGIDAENLAVARGRLSHGAASVETQTLSYPVDALSRP